MPFDSTPLISLQTESEQKEWLTLHTPTRNDELIATLEAESSLRIRKDPKSADAIIKIMTLTAELWSDQEIVAKAMYLDATTHWALGEHKVALALYEAAMNLYQSLGLPLEAARVGVGRLNAMMYLGQNEEALTLANQIEETFSTHQDHLSLAKLMMNRGNISFRLSQYQDALTAYQTAQTLFQQLGDTQYVAMAQVNAASMQMMLDQFDQARQILEAARQTFVDLNLEGTLALTDHNLAELSFYQGNYQEALRIFNRAKTTFIAQENEVDAAYVDLYRTDIYLALNLWSDALSLSQETRPVFEEAEMMWEVGRLWLNEAVALAHLGDGRSPTDALAEARTTFKAENNQIWLAAADLYEATFARLNNQHDLALARAQQAVAIYEEAEMPSHLAQCFTILGDVLIQQEAWQEAEQMFQRALQQIEGITLPAILYACHFGLGQIAIQQNDVPAARHHLQLSIEAVEHLQATIGAEDYKIAFLSDKMRVYEAYVLLCLQQGDEAGLNEAFETVEKAKSRALLDLLAREIKSSKRTEEEAELLAQLDKLKRELNWYYNRLNGGQDNQERTLQQKVALTTAVSEREAQLSKLLHHWRQPDLATTPNNPIWTVNVRELQKSLPADTLLLEYFISGEQIILFGLTKETIWSHYFELSAAEAKELLGQYRFQINKFSYGAAYRRQYADTLLKTTNHTLQGLFDGLIGPVFDRLTKPNLIIIPHGVLHYIPFHALYDGEYYLIDHKSISYAPSATILFRLLNQRDTAVSSSPTIIGLDDPTIPFAQQEAEYIAALFPDAKLYLADAANMQRMQENGTVSPFLHLATHATFRKDNPLFSALKFADGWLNVNDIYDLNAIPPLVTLSACETGRYQIAIGDELMGLCRGLISAGARSIIVSLWMVEDAATSKMMQEFYAKLQAGKSISTALRVAQLKIKEQNPHPYYWAPFILLGQTQNPLKLTRQIQT